MLVRPRLKTYLTVFPLSETTWGLRGGSDELWRVQLGDHRAMKVFGSLLPYLAGRHTSEEILDALEADGVERDATAPRGSGLLGARAGRGRARPGSDRVLLTLQS